MERQMVREKVRGFPRTVEVAHVGRQSHIERCRGAGNILPLLDRHLFPLLVALLLDHIQKFNFEDERGIGRDASRA